MMSHRPPTQSPHGVAISVAVVSLALAASAVAATFQVDRTDDTAAATACTVAPSDCSLRGAVIAANTSPADDRIMVPAGTYVLTQTGVPEDNAATGDLDILSGSGDLEIEGVDAASTIIDGNGRAW